MNRFSFRKKYSYLRSAFNPIGVVDVNPGEPVIVQVENGTPGNTDDLGFRLEADFTVPSGVVFRSLVDGRNPWVPGDEARITVNIVQEGTYYLFGNCASDDGSSDSFFVTIDAFDFDLFEEGTNINDLPGDVQNFPRFNLDPDDGSFHRQFVTSEALDNTLLSFQLDAGEHVINWHVREPGARLDWIGITDNPDLDLSTVVEPEPVSVNDWLFY